MYHTDYSTNRRKVQHKNSKTLSPCKTSRNHRIIHDHELLRAVLAIVLVILALLQMDPANAQNNQPSAGYGTLELENGTQPSTVASVKNHIQMIIADRHLEIRVDQLFKNSGKQIRNAYYFFPLTTDAQIRGWRVQLGQTVTCSKTAKFDCSLDPVHANSKAGSLPNFVPTRVIANYTKNQLRIPIQVMNLNEIVRVQLDIHIPLENTDDSTPALLPFTDDFEEELAGRVSDVVQATQSQAPIHPTGVLLPL